MRIKQPLVSIGVPTYNRSRFLREAIDSVLNQTYTNFELIISDNASTDDTERLCKEYSNKDKRIKYFRQKENIGIDANFYFVLNEAHGEYFAWLPDDDLYSPQFIEKLLEGFVDESVAGVFCREICFDRKGHRTVLRAPDISVKNSYQKNLFIFLVKCYSNLCLSIFSTKIRPLLLKANATDWNDALAINILLSNFKMNIVEGNFFTSRVVEKDRRLISPSLRKKIFRFSYFPYLSKSLFIFWESKVLSTFQKFYFSILLILQVIYFFITNVLLSLKK